MTIFRCSIDVIVVADDNTCSSDTNDNGASNSELWRIEIIF